MRSSAPSSASRARVRVTEPSLRSELLHAPGVTWIKGKHSIKVGYEFRHHQFNFHGWAASTGGSFNFSRLGTGGYDANGNVLSSTGDPFASFLLGVADSGST